MRHLSRLLLLLVGGLVLASCSGSDAAISDGQPTNEPATTAAPSTQSTSSAPKGSLDDDQQFPKILDVRASYNDTTETWQFNVTISSPYDTPERYADGWRVLGPEDTEGVVYGEHTLTHDHASEQPFTRSQQGVQIPDDVDSVRIEGRDRQNGFGGELFVVLLTR